jgi:hypothetical protein
MHAPKAARGLHYLSAAAADAADALAQLHALKVTARHGDSFSFLFQSMLSQVFSPTISVSCIITFNLVDILNFQ